MTWGTVTDSSVRVQSYATGDLSLYFSDIIDHIEKAWETLEEIRETIEIYKDSDFILSSEKTNRVLSILTIVFTLSIPATLIGTIYGMNVTLPGGNGQPLTFLGPYTSFMILVFVMSVSSLVMAWHFRRLRWF